MQMWRFSFEVLSCEWHDNQNRSMLMGIVIESHQMADKEEILSRLSVYMKAREKIPGAKSVSKELADGLLACKPSRRSMKLE